MAASTSESPPVMAPERAYPGRPILAASIAVFRAGRVLIAERVRPPAAGCFSLPGGLVESGETLEAGALRELHEETGVVARVGGFAGHVEVIDRDAVGRVARHFVVAAFWGDWVLGEAEPREDTGRVVWAEPARIADWPLTPGLERIVGAAWAARTKGI